MAQCATTCTPTKSASCGPGWIDDCFIMSLNYITDYTYSGNVTTNHSVVLQVSLRTLGGTSQGGSLGQ